MTCTNIHITKVSEKKKKKIQGAENLPEEIITENSLNWERKHTSRSSKHRDSETR